MDEVTCIRLQLALQWDALGVALPVQSDDATQNSRGKVEIPSDPLMPVEPSFQLTMEQLRFAEGDSSTRCESSTATPCSQDMARG